MVVPRAVFRGGTLYRPKYRWKPKKKKVFAYQSVGFRSQKKKNKPKWYHLKMVTPVAGPSPNDATGYLTETFQAPAS